MWVCTRRYENKSCIWQCRNASSGGVSAHPFSTRGARPSGDEVLPGGVAVNASRRGGKTSSKMSLNLEFKQWLYAETAFILRRVMDWSDKSVCKPWRF